MVNDDTMDVRARVSISLPVLPPSVDADFVERLLAPLGKVCVLTTVFSVPNVRGDVHVTAEATVVMTLTKDGAHVPREGSARDE